MSRISISLMYAAVGCLLAVGITATMDATGYALFSAFPLIGIVAVLWALQRFSRAEMGFVISTVEHYLIALAYPVLVLGAMVAIAFGAGVIDTSEAEWTKTTFNIAIASSIGCIMVLITEEWFFRGWLWATLRRADISEVSVWLITTLVFVVWHISWAVCPTGFELPFKQVLIYLVNVFLLGGIWGLMRSMSRSVFVPTVSHAFWNALTYSLFGTGSKVGDLGITQTEIYGPEVGYWGLALNACFLCGLEAWRRWRSPSAAQPGALDHQISSN